MWVWYSMINYRDLTEKEMVFMQHASKHVYFTTKQIVGEILHKKAVELKKNRKAMQVYSDLIRSLKFEGFIEQWNKGAPRRWKVVKDLKDVHQVIVIRCEKQDNYKQAGIFCGEKEMQS